MRLLVDWYSRHPFLSGFIAAQGLPIVGAIINWILYFPHQDGWAEFERRRPRTAKAIRLFRAMWPHLRKLQALRPLSDAVVVAHDVEREAEKEEAKEVAAEAEKEKTKP